MSGRHRSRNTVGGGRLSVVAGTAAVITLTLATVFAVAAGRTSDRPPQPADGAVGAIPVASAPTVRIAASAAAATTRASATPAATGSVPSSTASSRPSSRGSSVAPSGPGASGTAGRAPGVTRKKHAVVGTTDPARSIDTPTRGTTERTHSTAKPARSTSTPAPARPVSVTGPVLPSSTPTALSLPSIGVAATATVELGLNADGTLQTPSLDDPDSRPGWYTGSPSPGAPGPAIILGHVDSARYGPGVFHSIGALRPGDPVEVQRTDGSVAVFTVDAVRSYEKKDFPTLQVYGNTDTAALRLITCGGIFDPAARSYDRNTVVFAHLAGSRAG